MHAPAVLKVFIEVGHLLGGDSVAIAYHRIGESARLIQ